MMHQHASSSSVLINDNDDQTSGGPADPTSSSISDENHLIQYGRDMLLALRCSSLVRPRPRYIDEAILARRSFCRVADLGGASGGAGPCPGGGGTVTAAGSVGGAGGFGTKRAQPKTALTRGGGTGTASAKADGEKSSGTINGQDKQQQQRRVTSASAGGKWFLM